LSNSWRDWPISAKIALKEELEKQVRELEGFTDFSQFQADPVGFCTDVLKETTLFPALEQILLSVRDYPVTVVLSANDVGKTWIAARAAAWFFKVFIRACVYMTAAPPEKNLKLLLWGELWMLYYAHPELFQGDRTRDMHIERNPKSFITGLTIPSAGTDAEREAKFSGKHAPEQLFIVDEGDAVFDPVYKGIESCQSGGYNRLLILLNPREESGTVNRYITEGKANVVQLSAFDHPNVITGKEVIPGGAVSREITVRRINEWTRELKPGESKAEGVFEVPEFLVGSVATDKRGRDFPPLPAGLRVVTDPACSYMVLGEYPAKGSNQLISKEWIAKARARYDAYVAKYGERPPVGIKAKAGLDVADEGDDLNAACFRYGGYVAPLRTWGGVDPLRSADYFMDMIQVEEKADYYDDDPDEMSGRHKIDEVNVDGTGVGASSAPYLRRQDVRANKIMVDSAPTQTTERGEFGTMRDQLWWSGREWLRADTGAMLPPDEELIQELLVATYEIKNGKIKVMDKPTMKKKLGRSPDKADSFNLTFADDGGIQFF